MEVIGARLEVFVAAAFDIQQYNASFYNPRAARPRPSPIHTHTHFYTTTMSDYGGDDGGFGDDGYEYVHGFF